MAVETALNTICRKAGRYIAELCDNNSASLHVRSCEAKVDDYTSG